MSDKTTLKGQVISGLFWKFGERITAQSVSFVISVILARILLPAHYGTISMIMVFIALANVLVSNGLGESLIQKKAADDLEFSTIFYCSLVFSILLYGLLFTAAPAIALFYENSELIPLIRVLALQVPLAGIKNIQYAYVSKHMLFRKFFFSALAGTIVSGAIGIIMALNGYGAWALVAQYLINSVIDMIVLFFTVNWRPRLMFSISQAKLLLGYGWKLMATQFINTFYAEIRNLIIGKKYTLEDLAFYNKGNQFPSLVISNINTSISTVLFPAMAKVNGNAQELKSLTRRSIRVSSYIIFPVMTGLMATAEPLIKIMLTEKWLFCVPYLRLCCMYWMFQPLQTANFQAIKAAGRSDLCLKLEVGKKLIGFLILFIAVWISLDAIVISNVLFGCISMLINIFPNKKLMDYGYREQLDDIAPALLLSAIMGIAIYGLHYWDIPDPLLLILQVTAGILIYGIGSAMSKNDSFEYLRAIISGQKRRNKT